MGKHGNETNGPKRAQNVRSSIGSHATVDGPATAYFPSVRKSPSTRLAALGFLVIA